MLTTAAASHATGDRFSSPLIPGRQDGLGDRWTTTAGDKSAVELLRIRSEVAATPGFADALRERVEQLTPFKDLAFATIRGLYEDGPELTIVATRVSGQRLSELTGRRIPPVKRPAFVARLLRKATGALAALEAIGPGVTHGAVTADRILLTPNGGVCLTEYAFASALQQLALWPEELFLQFGLLAPAEEHGQASFEPQTSVMQLAAVALSVLLDQPITHDDFEHRLPALIDAVGATGSGTSSLLIRPLETWLEHALHVRDAGYASAGEAEAALKQLLAAAGPAAATELEVAAFPPATAPSLVERAVDERPAGHRPPAPPAHIRPAAPPVAQPVAALPPDPAPTASHVVPARQRRRYGAWVALGFAVLSIGEAAFIARLLIRGAPAPVEPTVLIESPNGTTVMVDGRPAGPTPLQLRITDQTRAIRLVPGERAASPGAVAPVAATPAAASAAAASTRAESRRTTTAVDLAAARQRSGGVAFSAPFELTVFEGDRVLGSTADGPIVAPAGTHTLDLVNSALGYRVREIVNIRAGSIGGVTITPPMGRISVNAQPWAQVLIDDTAVGDTPIANIPATLGEHQITFRHPQLGERRERVTVRADAPARVSTTFQRP